MARRKNKTGIWEGLASRIPWWVSLIAAVVLYWTLHSIAVAPIAPVKGAKAMSGVFTPGLIKHLASIGQYVIPIILLIGAAVSASYRPRRGHHRTIDELLEESDAWVGEKIEPTLKPSRNFYEIWKNDLPELKQQNVPKDRWSIELLRVLEWKRFEEVCSGLFERLGFSTKTTRFGADGGVDIHLFKSSTERADVIVQCKAWNTYKVGIKPVRELLGVMASTGVPEGIFITTGAFTREAQGFGRANRIDCMDGESLLAAIRTLVPADQVALLKLATAGDYLTPTCASCGIKMVKRQSRRDNQQFWGCSNYPRCRLVLRLR